MFHGDNLELMRSMNSKSVALVATDPPFNKGKDFHATPESLAAGASFQDRWRWEEDVHPEWTSSIQDGWPAAWAAINSARITYGDDMAAFLCFMAIRLVEMHRILRDDGSIYVHCDSGASHYLKTLMDAIFGRKQFQNEIVWCYAKPRPASRRFPENHDILLFYTKKKDWTFHPQRTPLMDGSFEYRKPFKRADGTVWEPRERGKQCASWWYDIPSFSTRMTAKEWTGYPTQKPLSLYQRIVRASSNPGDVVFDPFAGCATTPVAAELENRQWIAADLWGSTRELVRERLEALATNDEGQLQMRLYDVVVRTEPLVRTDAGETWVPARRSLERKDEKPSENQKERVDTLNDGKPYRIEEGSESGFAADKRGERP